MNYIVIQIIEHEIQDRRIGTLKIFESFEEANKFMAQEAAEYYEEELGEAASRDEDVSIEVDSNSAIVSDVGSGERWEWYIKMVSPLE